MSHDTIQREEMHLAGFETRASNDDPTPIGELWGRFLSSDSARDLPGADDAIVAVYCEYEGDHTQPYTFFLGKRVAPDAQVPAEFARRRVPGGDFARFVAEGAPPQSIMEAWGRIWAAPIERRFDADYEIHTGPTRAEIYVGVGA